MADEADSTLRVCKHCKIEKPLTAFVKMSGGSGYKHQCRECRSAQRRTRYAARAGEYANHDAPDEVSKRRANRKAQIGKYQWEDSWLNRLSHKECTRCKIELPANPAWFPKNTSHVTGLDSWCHACVRAKYHERRSYRVEKSRERYARYRVERPEHLVAQQRKYYRNNKERVVAQLTQWAEENPEKMALARKARSNRRRARLRNAEGAHNYNDIRALYDAQKGKCWYCQTGLTEYHVDHRIPLAKGGTNDPSNLVIACPPCNLSKGARMPWELEKPRLL